MGSFSRRLVPLSALFALASCWNYSSDGRITVERSVSAGNVSLGQTFVLTTVLRNQTGAPLEGVFLTEHLPAGLRVDGAAVEVDLADVTHRARLENGASGDVWAGCTPCRVVLWSPGEVPDPVAVASVLAVDLRLAVDAPGVYDLGRNNWAGRIAGGESVFGWGEASLRIVCPDASVFVPYPHGNGEQARNAALVVDAGGGLLLPDAECTATWVARAVPPLLADAERLRGMTDALRGVARVDAASELARRTLEVVA